MLHAFAALPGHLAHLAGCGQRRKGAGLARPCSPTAARTGGQLALVNLCQGCRGCSLLSGPTHTRAQPAARLCVAAATLVCCWCAHRWASRGGQCRMPVFGIAREVAVQRRIQRADSGSLCRAASQWKSHQLQAMHVIGVAWVQADMHRSRTLRQQCSWAAHLVHVGILVGQRVLGPAQPGSLGCGWLGAVVLPRCRQRAGLGADVRAGPLRAACLIACLAVLAPCTAETCQEACTSGAGLNPGSQGHPRLSASMQQAAQRTSASRRQGGGWGARAAQRRMLQHTHSRDAAPGCDLQECAA